MHPTSGPKGGPNDADPTRRDVSDAARLRADQLFQEVHWRRRDIARVSHQREKEVNNSISKTAKRLLFIRILFVTTSFGCGADQIIDSSLPTKRCSGVCSGAAIRRSSRST